MRGGCFYLGGERLALTFLREEGRGAQSETRPDLYRGATVALLPGREREVGLGFFFRERKKRKMSLRRAKMPCSSTAKRPWGGEKGNS